MSSAGPDPDDDVTVLGGGAPGEHCAGALAQGGVRVADVDVAAVLVWRDFMVSNYSDAGQERRLADRGIALIRGEGRLAGTGVVEVDGSAHTATDVVVRVGDDFVVELADGRQVYVERVLVATGRRPRVDGIGLETVGITPGPEGIQVDGMMRARERLWAIGDVTGIWPLTHMGEYEGEVVASNILGEVREANYDAVPRVVDTDPQTAAVGATTARFSATVALADVARMATCTPADAEQNGFLTLLSDDERLTGAYALGPEAGEWLQQATLAIRAAIPLTVLRGTIQPFPSFSEIHAAGMKALRREISAAA